MVTGSGLFLYLLVSSTACETGVSLKNVSRMYDDVEKPPNDPRQYRALVLDNGMKVLLISDPESEKASAALSIAVGSLHSPKELQGLAHLVEHMLTRQSEKYPEDNEFFKFVSNHGGHRNAQTQPDTTEFYFSILPDHLMAALDRFAQFFIAPLFKKEMVEREIMAVNSEHEHSSTNDFRRALEVLKSLLPEDHDMKKFFGGNNESLLHAARNLSLDLRQEAEKFVQKFYSSNIMSLVVQGREHIDFLTETVSSLFCVVPNKNVEKSSWSAMNPFAAPYTGYTIEQVPFKPQNSIIMFFATPYLTMEQSQIAEYVRAFISSEDSGSLQEYLTSKLLISDLSVTYHMIASGLTLLIIEFLLTDKGFQRKDEIIQDFFRYVNMIKMQKPQKWMQDQSRQEDQNYFNYQYYYDLINNAMLTDIATDCGSVSDIRETLSARYKLRNFSSEGIEQFLSSLNANNFNILTMHTSFKNTTDKVEKWTGAEYSVKKLSTKFLSSLQALTPQNDTLRMPARNEYIPQIQNTNGNKTARLQQFMAWDDKREPKVVYKDAIKRLWYMPDEIFYTPKVVVSFILRTPFAKNTIRNIVLGRIMVAYLDQAAGQKFFKPIKAGYKSSLSISEAGLKMEFSGYPEKIQEFVTGFTKLLLDNTSVVSSSVFYDKKKEMIDELLNFNKTAPKYIANRIQKWLQGADPDLLEEMLQEIKDIEFAEAQQFLTKILKRLRVEAFVSGNYNEQEAAELFHNVCRMIEEKCSPSILMNAEMKGGRRVILPPGASFEFHKTIPRMQTENAIVVVYQEDPSDTKQRYAATLLMRFLNPYCFDQLRTIEQLGYTVMCSAVNSAFIFLIQGPYHSSYIETRIEYFISTLKKLVHNSFNISLEKNKFARQINTKPKNFDQYCDEIWSQIFEGTYRFNGRSKLVHAVESLQFKDIIEYIEKVLLPSSTRRKLAVHVNLPTSQVPLNGTYDSLRNSPPIITSIQRFKNQMHLDRLPKTNPKYDWEI